MKIYYYVPTTVNDSFKNPEDNPSFRLRCLNIHNNLIKEGYSSHIVSSTSEIIDPDIVVLMSIGEDVLSLAKWLKKQNKVIIHDYTENIRGIPILEETKSLCNYIACASTFIGIEEKKQYPEKVVVIRDPIETSQVIHNPNHENAPLRVVWCGIGGNAFWVKEFLEPIINDAGMQYVEISNRPESTVQWESNTWFYYMASCDICVCPQIQWIFPAKSNVKVTTAMSLGLPVLASPIMSYEELIKNGENGYLCDSFEDWRKGLENLKSKEIRNAFVEKSFKRILPYSLESIYSEWKNLFKRCIK